MSTSEQPEGLTVLMTNVRLDGRTGTETWVQDAARELQRQGHRPVVYTPRGGPIAEALRRDTIPVIGDPRDLAEAPDVIHGHHTNPTLTALLAFPRTPGVLFVHDWDVWHDRPVRHPRIRRIAPVDATCADRALEAGFAADEVELVPNFVDLARFSPRGPLPTRPRRALLFDNAAHPGNHGGVIARACEQAGIALDVAGAATGTAIDRPEEVLGQYDLVFAKAKAALEAMASGCAVVLVHERGVGGLVTSASFGEMRRLNFGRRLLREPVGEEVLAAHLAAYDADDAAAVTARVRQECSLSGTVTRLVGLYREMIAEQAVAGDEHDEELRALGVYLRSIELPLEEGAHAPHLRAERDAQRAQLDADAAELAELHAQLEVKHLELDATHAHAGAAAAAAREALATAEAHAVAAQADARRARDEAEAEAARARAAERAADEARRAFAALRGTRRWQLVQRVMSPFDALRRRRG